MNVESHEEIIHPEPTGFFRKYVWSYDHKVIAKQYFFTTMCFLLLGGFLAMLIRWQLAYPFQPVPILGKLLASRFFFDSTGAITPSGYLQIVTLHGTIMVFFVMIPLLVGAFGNFLIPLQIGARDVAFPLLNALSYWLYVLGGIVILSSLFLRQGAAESGWTAYPPLSDVSTATPGSGMGQIFWLIAIFIVGFSSIVGGINFLTTIVKMRAPGMTWGRLPLVTWAQLITAVFQTLATPVLGAAATLMLCDKLLKTAYFIPTGLQSADQLIGGAGGGHPLLWQHLFWFYSHPAVYILVLPAMGIASELIATFSRKPIFGYKPMVVSLAVIMGLGFVVWGHHMFVSGMSPAMATGFMMTTMLIALPSSVKVFNWLGTLWKGSIQLTSAGLCGISFVAMFIIGGLSGIFLAATPVDIYLHDSYYVIAHFHYIVFGASLFAIFGGIYYWFPKMFGRMMNERLGKLHWLLTFITFNLTFFPMHFLGEGGQMRRLATITNYEFLQPLQNLNVFISIAAFLLGISQLIFIFNFFYSMLYGKKAPANPWNATGLEWTLPSPVPYYNFEKIPMVYRGPYEYSSPEALKQGKDWIAQSDPLGFEKS